MNQHAKRLLIGVMAHVELGIMMGIAIGVSAGLGVKLFRRLAK